MAEKIKNFFSKGSPKQSYDPDAVAYAQQLLAGQEPPDAASQASRDSLEINIHTIDDAPLSRQLENLSIIPAQEEKIVRLYNDKGAVTAEIPVAGAPARPVPWAMATRVAISPVNSTRFITKRIAMKNENKMRGNFLKMRVKMGRIERDYFSDYLNFMEDQACGGIYDSVDGQKMLALKTTGKNMKVRINNNEPSGVK